MNACIYRTVKSVFPGIFEIPGDVNLFIASANNYRVDISSNLLANRIIERGLKTNLLNQVHLDYRFQEDRRQWYISLVDLPAIPLNKDFAPKGLITTFSSTTFFSPHV